MPPTVSISQAGQLLGVSRRTIYYWITREALTTVRRGGSQRILRASIEHIQQYGPPPRAARRARTHPRSPSICTLNNTQPVPPASNL
jgi:excisionase family DNA binding protein